jgi:hypothetical protein
MDIENIPLLHDGYLSAATRSAVRAFTSIQLKFGACIRHLACAEIREAEKAPVPAAKYAPHTRLVSIADVLNMPLTQPSAIRDDAWIFSQKADRAC